MSRTLDANVLLYASDASSPHHAAARAALVELAQGPELVTLFWPTVMAYLRIATHPSIFASPLSMDEATADIEHLLARPHVRTTGEGPAFWARFREVADDARPAGHGRSPRARHPRWPTRPRARQATGDRPRAR